MFCSLLYLDLFCPMQRSSSAAYVSNGVFQYLEVSLSVNFNLILLLTKSWLASSSFVAFSKQSHLKHLEDVSMTTFFSPWRLYQNSWSVLGRKSSIMLTKRYSARYEASPRCMLIKSSHRHTLQHKSCLFGNDEEFCERCQKEKKKLFVFLRSSFLRSKNVIIRIVLY